MRRQPLVLFLGTHGLGERSTSAIGDGTKHGRVQRLSTWNLVHTGRRECQHMVYRYQSSRKLFRWLTTHEILCCRASKNHAHPSQRLRYLVEPGLRKQQLQFVKSCWQSSSVLSRRYHCPSFKKRDTEKSGLGLSFHIKLFCRL